MTQEVKIGDVVIDMRLVNWLPKIPRAQRRAWFRRVESGMDQWAAYHEVRGQR